MEKKRILIVDDEEAFGDIVKLNLEYTGEFEVLAEKRGSEALNAARHFRPDLIILDVLMPDMDGPAVLKELRKDKDFKNTPVIFLTALVSKNQSADGRNQPYVASKPISSDDLLEIVRRHLK